MKMSILITCFQRSHLLRWHLRSLVRQYGIEDCEIIVLNDGIQDSTEQVCIEFNDRLNIKYIFTGQRNTPTIKWRIPGFCLNVGIKQASYDFMIISCAEMYLVEDDIIQAIFDTLSINSRQLVITEGKEDRKRYFLKYLEQTNGMYSANIYNKLCGLGTFLPFYMGLSKNELMHIGGFDEDFIGNAWDDNDIISRLQKVGCMYNKLDNKHVVHLYHKRRHSMVGHDINKKLYEDRINTIIRNGEREWGVLHE